MHQQMQSISQGVGQFIAIENVVKAWQEVEQARAGNSELGESEALAHYGVAGNLVLIYCSYEALVDGITHAGYRVSIDANEVGQPLKVERVN